MTEDEFDELASRLYQKLGYDSERKFCLDLIFRGAQRMELTPAEMVALGGADISEIAGEGGSVQVPDMNVGNALVEGMMTYLRVGMDKALREWAAEEYAL